MEERLRSDLQFAQDQLNDLQKDFDQFKMAMIKVLRELGYTYRAFPAFEKKKEVPF